MKKSTTSVKPQST